MNIFVLSENPREAARLHCDKHVVKMILESAQMISTTLNYYGIRGPYKTTHLNHPCTIWARQSSDNFMWLWELARSLNEEYVFRYEKYLMHLAWNKIRNTVIPMKAIPWPERGLTPFAQAMPDQYKNENAVTAYRAYYLGEKSHLLQYTRRELPEWVKAK